MICSGAWGVGHNLDMVEGQVSQQHKSRGCFDRIRTSYL